MCVYWFTGIQKCTNKRFLNDAIKTSYNTDHCQSSVASTDLEHREAPPTEAPVERVSVLAKVGRADSVAFELRGVMDRIVNIFKPKCIHPKLPGS